MAIKKASGGAYGKHIIELTYDNHELALVSGKAGNVNDIRYALGFVRDGADFFADQQRDYYRKAIDGIDETGAATSFAGSITAAIDPFRDKDGNERDRIVAARELAGDVQALIEGDYIVGKTRQDASLGAAYQAIADHGVAPEEIGVPGKAFEAAIDRYHDIKERRAKADDISVEKEKGYLGMRFSRHNYRHFIDSLEIEKGGSGLFTVRVGFYPFDKQTPDGERVEFFHGVTNLPPESLMPEIFITRTSGIPAAKIKYGALTQGRPLDMDAPPKTIRGFGSSSFAELYVEGKEYPVDARIVDVAAGDETVKMVIEPVERPQPAVVLQGLTAQELRRFVKDTLFTSAGKGISPMSESGPGVDALKEFMASELGTEPEAQQPAPAKSSRYSIRGWFSRK